MGLWLLLVALLAWQDGKAFVTGSFSGNLERVGNESISIRLSDRRIVDALLPNQPPLDSQGILAEYSMGDYVEIACRRIQPTWEEGTLKYQTLQVTSLRLLKHPSAEELAKILANARFHEGKNLLTRPMQVISQPVASVDMNAPGGRELAQARRINLEYAEHMPNFVADEKAKRYRMGPRASTWRDFDVVESEISFRGNRVTRQQIRRNGSPWDQPFEGLPGFKWYEGFGSEIGPLFDPKCPTKIEYRGTSKVQGKTLLAYRFSTPVDGCFTYFFFDYQRYNPARTGQVLIDDPTGNIIQLDEHASGFPVQIEFAEREEHITWDYVKIGPETHLLPVRTNFQVHYYDGTRYRIEVEYKNHRHFESSTTITYQ